MKSRLYLYLSKYNSADRQLCEYIISIPARRRNNVIKEILLEAFVARNKRAKTKKAQTSSSHDPFSNNLTEFDSPLPSSSFMTSSERTPNPLDNLQRALDTIPLKTKRPQ